MVQSALEAYGTCLKWIADNNLSIRRDVLEGMARCCTKLGQRDKALNWADLLVNLFQLSEQEHLKDTEPVVMRLGEFQRTRLSCH